jgi:hypothetical protein
VIEEVRAVRDRLAAGDRSEKVLARLAALEGAAFREGDHVGAENLDPRVCVVVG